MWEGRPPSPFSEVGGLKFPDRNWNSAQLRGSAAAAGGALCPVRPAGRPGARRGAVDVLCRAGRWAPAGGVSSSHRPREAREQAHSGAGPFRVRHTGITWQERTPAEHRCCRHPHLTDEEAASEGERAAQDWTVSSEGRRPPRARGPSWR